MQPQPTPNMYVQTPGNNISGNVRTNQQPGIFRGPQSSAGSAPRNGGTRPIPMQTMYSQSMPQGVLQTYQPFQYRNPYQATPYSYTPQIQANYFPFPYFSTIPQTQPHQRPNIGVSSGVTVSTTMPGQSGPNGQLSGPPGATQAQLPIVPGSVMGSITPSSNTVMGVPSGRAPQQGAISTMGCVTPLQPASGRKKHILKIINPYTKKDILEELNLDKNSAISSETEYNETISSGGSIEIFGIASDPQQQQGESIGLGVGVVLMPPDKRTDLPFPEVDKHGPQRDGVIGGQTPIVSAMSDAPSFEILSTPQKPRSKKILPVVNPKDSPNVDKSLLFVGDKICQDKTLNAANISTTTTPECVQEFQLPSVTTHSHIENKIDNENEESESATGIEVSKPCKKYDSIIQKSFERPLETGTLTYTVTEESSCVSDVNNSKNPSLFIENRSEVQSKLSGVSKNEDLNQSIEKNDGLDPGNSKTDEVHETVEIKKKAKQPGDSPREHDNAQKNERKDSVTIKNILSHEKSKKDRTNEQLNDIIAKKEEKTIIQECDETDRATQNSARHPESRNKKSIQNDIVLRETNLSVDAEQSNNVKSFSTISEMKGKALINYNEGQWSPINPTGKKQYDREQLMQLRAAKASRLQPEVNNSSILPQSNLMPSFVQNNNNKRVQSMVGSVSSNRGSVGGSNVGKQASMSGIYSRNSTKLEMIHVNLSLSQDVKLNETNNAWRPRILKEDASGENDNDVRQQREKDDLVRRVRGILNKLTPEKFDALAEEIIKLKIDTPDKMEDVMVLVFEKAIDEPNFSVSYARLCQRLSEVQAVSDQGMESGTKTNLAKFRVALVDKTEREFKQNVLAKAATQEKLKPIIDKIKTTTDPSEKADLQEILEEEDRKIRRRSGGTVRFIGELFKITLLTRNIIHFCISNLLNPRSEDMLEYLCKLLTTVGAMLDQPQNTSKDSNDTWSLDNTFSRMQSIASKSDKDGAKISSRVRFMLQDVIDLRKNKWQSTRNEAPKTMEQIEKEAKTEQLSSQYYSGVGGNSTQLISGNSKRDDRGSSNSRFGEVRNSSGNYGGSHSQRGDNSSVRRQQQGSHINSSNPANSNANSEWQYKTSKGSRSCAVDTTKLEMINQNFDTTKKMGEVSQFQWPSSRQSSTTPTTKPSNSFAALSAFVDSNKSSDREHDRDRERNSQRNKNSLNRESVERDRYNDKGIHSRTGSSNASRESSTSRNSHTHRSAITCSSSQKSAGHSKYTQNQFVSMKISGKTSGLSPSTSTNSYNLLLSDQQCSPSSTGQNKPHQDTPDGIVKSSLCSKETLSVVFEETCASDQKLFKSVISEMIENIVNSKNIAPSTVDCFPKINVNHQCSFIYYILTVYLHLRDVGPIQRRHLANIVAYLIQSNYISKNHVILAYEHFSQSASDLIVDVPALWLYICEFMGPLITKKILTINDLWNEKLRNEISPTSQKKFLETLLIYCTREIGPAFTRTTWKNCNMKWTDYMSEEEVDDFIKRNNLEYIEDEAIQPEIDIKESKEKHFQRVFENVEYLLKNGAIVDTIIDYINGNLAKIERNFIQILTAKLCECTVNKKDDNYKLDTVRFKKVCIPVLQRYIDSTEELELECLYAMQFFVHKLEHPRGLLNELFGILFEDDIIPHDTFIKWRDLKDQSVGKGVAVKQLNAFFNHLLSGGETSDDNN